MCVRGKYSSSELKSWTLKIGAGGRGVQFKYHFIFRILSWNIVKQIVLKWHNRFFAVGGSRDHRYLKSISYDKMISRNGKNRLILKWQSFSYWLQICKIWQATENRIFCKDLYDWRASLALHYHFHIHFYRKPLILYSQWILKYLTFRLETMSSN